LVSKVRNQATLKKYKNAFKIKLHNLIWNYWIWK
jgi:hypothetical protein